MDVATSNAIVTCGHSSASCSSRYLGEAIGQLERGLPKVAAMLGQAEEDILAHRRYGCPPIGALRLPCLPRGGGTTPARARCLSWP